MSEVLVHALLDPDVYSHPVHDLQLIETHISWVILTGPFVYKIKKPIDLGFLDFSTLDKREFFCARELELNKRLAPQLYLTVVSITGSAQRPAIDGDGEVIEYAVKMAQFPQEAQLDRMLHTGKLTQFHISATADKVAEFHLHLVNSHLADKYGSPGQVLAPIKENFSQIRQRQCSENTQELDALETWVDRQYSQLVPVMAARKAAGFIRDCHGDIHLRNVAWHENEIVIFDCIEFSDDLRRIDVISEVAFMVMDLDHRKRKDLGSWFLNRYLEHTGDYAGLRLLRFYLVYRALVRAKVDCIRANQEHISTTERAEALQEYLSYVRLASSYTQYHRPVLILMYGLSGSGKTHVSDSLLTILPAVRIRSDIERKRLYGLEEKDRTGGGVVNAGIYTQSASQRTYALLQEYAEIILKSGYNVIIDAAFLYRHQRSVFLEFAESIGSATVILECSAPDPVLKQRIRERIGHDRDASDADIEVLQHQLKNREPLDNAELKLCISVDTSEEIDINALSQSIKQRCNNQLDR